MTPLRRLGLSAFLLAFATTAPALAQPPVWTVQSAHARLVIFGSVHLLPPGLDWMPPPLAEAVKRGDEVWFEIPIDSATQEYASRRLLERGALPKGDTLFSHLSSAQTARLRRACLQLHARSQALATMQPWLADVTLSLLQDSRTGGGPSEGVEQQVQKIIPAGAVRRAFETADEQVSILADTPMRDQVASLDETLREISDDPQAFSRVLDEWMAGDIAALQKDVLAPIRSVSPVVYRRLIADRNARWADALAGRLNGDGEVVVVVGVGHLIGPGGVPALLRARGYAVSGP